MDWWPSPTHRDSSPVSTAHVVPQWVTISSKLQIAMWVHHHYPEMLSVLAGKQQLEEMSSETESQYLQFAGDGHGWHTGKADCFFVDSLPTAFLYPDQPPDQKWLKKSSYFLYNLYNQLKNEPSTCTTNWTWTCGRSCLYTRRAICSPEMVSLLQLILWGWCRGAPLEFGAQPPKKKCHIAQELIMMVIPQEEWLKNGFRHMTTMFLKP